MTFVTGATGFIGPALVARRPGRRPRGRTAATRVFLGVVLGLAGLDAAEARSPLVDQLDVVATRYHEDPSRLDALRERLEEPVRDDPDRILLELAADWTVKDVSQARRLPATLGAR